MRLYSENNEYKLYEGNMLDMLDVIEPNSIGSIVTDPPYELGFMGKTWDSSGIAFQPDTWYKCYQVLKPGGYLLAFGGSRTFHRIACAIEDAGFEIRDTICWLYGSGFPKSMSISKGIEAREKLGNAGTRNKRKIEQACDTEEYTLRQTNNGAMGEIIETTRKQYIPNTDLAKKWDGWGTCLKPSFEPIIVARKPLDGTCIDNVIKWGVGGINIDECRVGVEELHNAYAGNKNTGFTAGDNRDEKGKGMFSGLNHGETTVNGRFPANTILTYDDTDFEEVCGGMPDTKSGTEMTFGSVRKKQPDNCYKLGFTQKEFNDGQIAPDNYGDSGNASRYFYCAKASKKDRDEGLEEFDEYIMPKTGAEKRLTVGGSKDISLPRKNTHPTVKPTDLIQYLVRLVTPNGETVLDPFNGSGSTGKAVMYENRERNKNYKYIGIELTPEYLPISRARIEYVCDPQNEITYEKVDEETNEVKKVSFREVSLF